MVILISSAEREKMAVIKSRTSPFLATCRSVFDRFPPPSLSVPPSFNLSPFLSILYILSLFVRSSLARTLFRTFFHTYSGCISIVHKVIEIQYVCRPGCEESPRFIISLHLSLVSLDGVSFAIGRADATTMRTRSSPGGMHRDWISTFDCRQ